MSGDPQRWTTTESISNEVAALLKRPHIALVPYHGEARHMRRAHFGWTTLDNLVGRQDSMALVPPDTILSGERPEGPVVLLVFYGPHDDHVIMVGEDQPAPRTEGTGYLAHVHHARAT
jgi:hypothetical protein